VPITKSFDIKLLKPFHRERDRMPHPSSETEDKIARLDPDLKPDEHAYVSHFLAYADVLLHEHSPETIVATPEFSDNVVEMPRRADAASSNGQNGKDKAA